MNVFVVDQENFDYDFLVGLDCIENFHLRQNEKLKITQRVDSHKNVNNGKETNKKIIPSSAGSKIEEKRNVPNENLHTPEENDTETDIEYKINFNEHVNVANFNILVNHLDTQQQSRIDELICKYGTLFAKDKYDIGTVKGYEAHIDLLIDKYCSKRPYRCTIEDKKEIEQQVSKLLQKNRLKSPTVLLLPQLH